jgi:ComF family protein
MLNPHIIEALYKPNIYNGVAYICSYQDDRVKALITENKYQHHPVASKLLALLLSKWLSNRLTGDLILIPLPLGAKRQKERGYNQVSIILKSLPTGDSILIAEYVLCRTKETKPQTSLPKSERLKNTIGAFAYSGQPFSHPQPRTIVLVDDVVTTGATFAAAKAALIPHVPPTTKIICLAIAH